MSDQRQIRQISQRLSLRAPQATSLEILANAISRLDLSKEADLIADLAAVQAVYPSVQDFEREFPSLCFALATGVGKTRLMGAFIAYLYLAKRSSGESLSKNFFVLAPNTTIYEKLIADFSPASAKYVFKGIAEFATVPPILVTGETWDQGRGVRGGDLFGQNTPIINIFNVDKINKEAGRIKKMHEYIGQSYFDYLSGLPDLVLLMDEAHRYRAKAGLKAITELRPVLGLELTATPRAVGAKSALFQNIVFDYPLGQAMADGFVKEPAVATQKDFDPRSVSPEELERIKLEDGVHYHEHVKVELDIYARNSGRQKIHPFMLLVAQDTAHAKSIRELIEADSFFGGRYKGRAIEVHSALRGDENDEAMARLVSLETDERTEIVIHVNKLKEGWDVTNLYTIVPLRASASDILTEQTLGRGLRLPYGERTGVEVVDTLTVIAHERFDEVIKAAREPGSVVAMKAIQIGAGGDVSAEGAMVLEAKSTVEAMLTPGPSAFGEQPQTPFVFDAPGEREAAVLAYRAIEQEERRLTGGIHQLNDPSVQARIAANVAAAIAVPQGTLEGVVAPVDVKKIVAAVTSKVVELTIEIPRIVIIPTRETNFGFRDFDLDGLSSIARQPLSNEIMIQQLRTESRSFLARTVDAAREERLENYLVRHLVDFPQVDYDAQADLLYKLSGQVVARLREYLTSDEDIENVLLVHGKDLARFIFEQMKEKDHYWETPTDYRATVSSGFQLLRPQVFNVTNINAILDYRRPVTPAADTKRHVFGGFKKCCYAYQRFQSNEEREFAVIVDSDHEPSVVRWMKPGSNQFRIEYTAGADYEPDFIVETTKEKLIVEIKAANEMNDPVVLAKAAAAGKWVGYANGHAKENGGKPWVYLLIPHNAVLPSATLAGLVGKYSRTTIAP
jgi:type III restriction enzyme